MVVVGAAQHFAAHRPAGSRGCAPAAPSGRPGARPATWPFGSAVGTALFCSHKLVSSELGSSPKWRCEVDAPLGSRHRYVAVERCLRARSAQELVVWMPGVAMHGSQSRGDTI